MLSHFLCNTMTSSERQYMMLPEHTEQRIKLQEEEMYNSNSTMRFTFEKYGENRGRRYKIIYVRVGVQKGNFSSTFHPVAPLVVSWPLLTPTPTTIAFTEDILLAATTCAKVKQRNQKGNDAFSRQGLRLNVNKTEYQEVGERTEDSLHINADLFQRPRTSNTLNQSFNRIGEQQQQPANESKRHGGHRSSV